MKKTIRVRCTLEFDVPWDDCGYDVDPFFDIEENHCPGTGQVGAALDAIIQENDAKSFCWACACNGENKIVAIDGVPVK